MTDFIASFVSDTKDAFARLDPILSQWEKDPSDQNAFEEAFRFVHTVRGNAGFLNLDRFERLCVPIEYAMSHYRKLDLENYIPLIPHLIAAIRHIDVLVEAIDAGIGLPVDTDRAFVAAFNMPDIKPLKKRDAIPAEIDQRAKTVRVPVALLDQLADAVDAVAQSQNHLLSVMEHAPQASMLQDFLSSASVNLEHLTKLLAQTRQMPIDRLLSGLADNAVAIASSLGKKVRVEIVGGYLQTDRYILEALRDPIMHLIRNAVDHGVEPSEERAAQLKSEIATLTIKALKNEHCFQIEISDDGQGIAPEIVSKTMDHDELLSLLMTPGFSGLSKPSTLSGHGIGLNVVKTALETLGGSVHLDTEQGKGTQITLRIPIEMKQASAA